MMQDEESRPLRLLATRAELNVPSSCLTLVHATMSAGAQAKSSRGWSESTRRPRRLRAGREAFKAMRKAEGRPPQRADRAVGDRSIVSSICFGRGRQEERFRTMRARSSSHSWARAAGRARARPVASLAGERARDEVFVPAPSF